MQSRGVYKIMGMVLEASLSFIFQLLCILFKNWFQILAIFCTYICALQNLRGFALNVSGPGIRTKPIHF